MDKTLAKFLGITYIWSEIVLKSGPRKKGFKFPIILRWQALFTRVPHDNIILKQTWLSCFSKNGAELLLIKGLNFNFLLQIKTTAVNYLETSYAPICIRDFVEE